MDRLTALVLKDLVLCINPLSVPRRNSINQ